MIVGLEQAKSVQAIAHCIANAFAAGGYKTNGSQPFYEAAQDIENAINKAVQIAKESA